MKNRKKTIIIAGGGTGGHIFSGISIASELQKSNNVRIIFVGAKGKMEEKIVPRYNIEFRKIRVEGWYRGQYLRNIKLPFILIISFLQTVYLISTLKPSVVVGVGGYASLPPVLLAQWLGLPTLILEQNSFPGIANKILSKKANTICTGFPAMERFFMKNKLKFTGNPIRQKITVSSRINQKEVTSYKTKINLYENTKTILVIGGSLGAKSINNCILHNITNIIKNSHQIIWQTGSLYYKDICNKCSKIPHRNIYITDFIANMGLAYASADVVVSRSGALSVSEVIYLQKPAIFIPSPNVPDNHQMKNAQALKSHNAAVVLEDNDSLPTVFLEYLFNILEDEGFRQSILTNLQKFYRGNAAEKIAAEIMKYSCKFCSI